jgi:ABC-type phosphate transport system substrate-binding protein
VAVAAVTLVVRLWQNRKILCYETVYDSKIGFHQPFEQPTSDAHAILNNFNSVSVVVLRVWNGGRAAIEEDDFAQPLKFATDGRFIVDFRASSPQPPQVATPEQVENAWRVSRAGATPNAPRSQWLDQGEVRGTLPESLYSEGRGGFTASERQMRRSLSIPPVKLRPGNSFKVVICLREDEDLDEDESPTKGYRFGGELRPGKIVQRGVRRRWRPTIAQVAAVALVGCLAAVLVLAFGPRPPEYCTDGDLQLVGSSAFSSMAGYAAEAFVQECTSSRITRDMNGSIEGVRRLAQEPGGTIAFSDGSAVEGQGFERDPVAVLTFNVVLNTTVGIDNLTTAQLRDINAGRVTNWSVLGGPDLPIRIVGRNADSGSRLAYERYVLGTGEAPVSSNSCSEQDRGFQVAATRCERQTTREVLETVDEIPGAIGYADAADVGGYSGVRPILIDGMQGTEEFLEQGYEFWTIEFAYRREEIPGSLVENFLGYLQRDSVARAMREEGYIPCQRSDGSLERLCRAIR